MSLADQINRIRTLRAEGKTVEEVAAAVGVEIGDVETVTEGGGAAAMPGTEGSSGGSVAGALAVSRFPFAFDTPGINTLAGATLTTLALGVLVLDGWVEIGTPWNGTTPMFDVLTVDPDDSTNEWGLCAAFLDATLPAHAHGGVVTVGPTTVFSAESIISDAAGILVPSAPQTGQPGILGLGGGETWGDGGQPCVPVRTAKDGTAVIVRATTVAGEPDPGATQGAAALYLVTATPA